MKLRNRVHQLERRIAALSVPLAEDDSDDVWAAWCHRGCVGPLPPAGPRPTKYTPEQWQAHHRLLLALSCRSLGCPDLPDGTEQERCQVDETLAFFTAIDPDGQLSLPQQARLAPYRQAIARFLNDPGGTSVPQASLLRGESA